MNALTVTGPAETFRSKASDLMIDAAKMTLHQLVDEFMRLTKAMEENTEPGDGEHYPELNESGKLASRERRMIVAAARARFGISFEEYDRSCGSSNSYDF